MASAQCYKPCEQTCQQKTHRNQQQQHGSIGQKVTGLFKGYHNKPHLNEGTQNQTQYYSEETEVIYEQEHVAKNQTYNNQMYAATENTAMKCQRGNKRENKRNMFQRIKDGVSGHNSDSGSGSSSDESDSDDENRCNRRTNVNVKRC